MNLGITFWILITILINKPGELTAQWESFRWLISGMLELFIYILSEPGMPLEFRIELHSPLQLYIAVQCLLLRNLLRIIQNFSQVYYCCWSPGNAMWIFYKELRERERKRELSKSVFITFRWDEYLLHCEEWGSGSHSIYLHFPHSNKEYFSQWDWVEEEENWSDFWLHD